MFIQCLVTLHSLHVCLDHEVCHHLCRSLFSSLFLSFSCSSPFLLLLVLLHLIDHIEIVLHQFCNFSDEQIQLYWDLTVQRDFRERLSPSELQRFRGDIWLVAVMQLDSCSLWWFWLWETCDASPVMRYWPFTLRADVLCYIWIIWEQSGYFIAPVHWQT